MRPDHPVLEPVAVMGGLMVSHSEEKSDLARWIAIRMVFAKGRVIT